MELDKLAETKQTSFISVEPFEYMRTKGRYNMGLLARLKLRIAAKILITLLGLSLASLIVFGYVSLRSMDRLGNYALESSASLGDHAVSDSTQALRHQAEQELITLAKDQATISDHLFDQIEAETSTLTSFATDLWSNTQSFSSRRSYSQEEPPDDIHAASVYVLAPGVSVDAVGSELDLSSNLDTIFIPITSSDANLTLVYIGTESGILRAYPWSSGIDPSYDPRVRSWYTRAKETGRIGWSEPYIDALSGNLIGVVGIDEYYAQCMPDTKLNKIREEKNSGRMVAMVGDGINDAPALAEANVGISMGAMGSEAAVEAGDVSLMKDNVSDLKTAIRFSKLTLSTIKMNILFAVVVNILAVGFASLGGLTMLWGAVVHQASALVVILNSI